MSVRPQKLLNDCAPSQQARCCCPPWDGRYDLRQQSPISTFETNSSHPLMPSSAAQMAACCPFLGELPYAVVLNLGYYRHSKPAGMMNDDEQAPNDFNKSATGGAVPSFTLPGLSAAKCQLPRGIHGKEQATPHRYPLPLR